MKNKEFYKLLKKNNLNSNSGFTLIELLVGLMMSIFVIGALGFGLMTVLQTSQSENSKVKARTENSRALDFISDEVRRARNIESFADSTNAPNFTTTDKTVVLALEIPEVSDSGTIDSDDNNTTKTERIVYYLKSTGLGNWKGPQVLYRWGPPLDANGNYDTGAWNGEALIDGINTTTVASPCATGTVTPASPTGFYACISLQDTTKAYDRRPTVTVSGVDIKNPNYNPRNTAQLFLTGQTKTASGVNNDSQTNDTQVIARARDTLANKIDNNTSLNWNVEGLGGNYKCKDVTTGGSTAPVWWHMRTDFSNSTDPNEVVSWTQNPNINAQQQPQPIEIDPLQDLTITSNPANETGCNSSELPVTHIVRFGDPTKFNGECDANLGPGTCPTSAGYPERVNNNQTVQFFKRGSSVPSYGTNGLSQQTLGKFLYDKGLAIIDTTNNTTTGTQAQILANRDTKFIIPNSLDDINTYKAYIDSLTSLTAAEKTAEKAKLRVLEEDQRIVGFEVGVHTATTQPGFDLQDNIFIVTSNAFKKPFAPSCFTGTACSPLTGRPTS